MQRRACGLTCNNRLSWWIAGAMLDREPWNKSIHVVCTCSSVSQKATESRFSLFCLTIDRFSRVIGCRNRLRNDLSCVGWVKLYSFTYMWLRLYTGIRSCEVLHLTPTAMLLDWRYNYSGNRLCVINLGHVHTSQHELFNWLCYRRTSVTPCQWRSDQFADEPFHILLQAINICWQWGLCKNTQIVNK